MVFLFIAMAFRSEANEGGGHEAPPAAEASGHGEAPAAGHGGGAEASESAKKPWLEVQSQLGGFKSKRSQMISTLQKLKAEKKHLHEGSPEMNEKVQEILKAYHEYKEASEEYNRLLVILKYRFPERLAKEEKRKYEAVDIQSQKELETQMDLDGRLNKTIQKAREQYSSDEGERQPASVSGDSAEPKTIRDEDAFLLQK